MNKADREKSKKEIRFGAIKKRLEKNGFYRIVDIEQILFFLQYNNDAIISREEKMNLVFKDDCNGHINSLKKSATQLLGDLLVEENRDKIKNLVIEIFNYEKKTKPAIKEKEAKFKKKIDIVCTLDREDLLWAINEGFNYFSEETKEIFEKYLFVEQIEPEKFFSKKDVNSENIIARVTSAYAKKNIDAGTAELFISYRCDCRTSALKANQILCSLLSQDIDRIDSDSLIWFFNNYIYFLDIFEEDELNRFNRNFSGIFLKLFPASFEPSMYYPSMPGEFKKAIDDHQVEERVLNCYIGYSIIQRDRSNEEEKQRFLLAKTTADDASTIAKKKFKDEVPYNFYSFEDITETKTVKLEQNKNCFIGFAYTIDKNNLSNQNPKYYNGARTSFRLGKKTECYERDDSPYRNLGTYITTGHAKGYGSSSNEGWFECRNFDNLIIYYRDNTIFVKTFNSIINDGNLSENKEDFTTIDEFHWYEPTIKLEMHVTRCGLCYSYIKMDDTSCDV